VLIVFVLLATVVLRVGIVLIVVYLVLPVTMACPRCGDKLILLRHPILRRLVPVLEHRWCLRCGWLGVVRRTARPQSQSRVINRAARS
jgi:hypothetical protein